MILFVAKAISPNSWPCEVFDRQVSSGYTLAGTACRAATQHSISPVSWPCEAFDRQVSKFKCGHGVPCPYPKLVLFSGRGLESAAKSMIVPASSPSTEFDRQVANQDRMGTRPIPTKDSSVRRRFTPAAKKIVPASSVRSLPVGPSTVFDHQVSNLSKNRMDQGPSLPGKIPSISVINPTGTPSRDSAQSQPATPDPR